MLFSIWECSGWFSDQTKTFELSHPITHFGGLPYQATFRIPVKIQPFHESDGGMAHMVIINKAACEGQAGFITRLPRLNHNNVDPSSSKQ